MTLNEILTLVQAGFTKADVMQLISQQPAEQQPAEQQPAQPQSIEARLDYLINRVNLMAVNNSNNPAPAGESVDDILASIINPKE